MVSGTVPQVLLLGPAQQRVRDLCGRLTRKGLPTNCPEPEQAQSSAALRTADVLVFVGNPTQAGAQVGQLKTLLSHAQAASVATLVWGAPAGFEGPEGLLIECLSADVGLDEVVERLTALARYAPLLNRMETELRQLQRLGRNLNRYFEEIDQEMRLTGRLQRDFLPRTLPVAPSLQFAQLYRPAAWVSGDIFDIFRVNERHLALFIADAMGHGTAAGLMSMFLRRALVPTQRQGESELVVSPAEVMCQLHESLVRQDFPHAQFVTAAYAIVDLASFEVRLARGGHPYPLHISASGEVRELRCDGGLLGVAGLEPAFEEHRCQLVPGDKVMFYTDGLEDVFIRGRDEQSEQPEYSPSLLRWAQLDAQPLVATIGDYLDHREGSLNPADDVTVVVLQVTR